MPKLEKVFITNFRNVKERELDLSIKNVIPGKNMSGKTNTLNAIHWAFTGSTLDGSNDNRVNFRIVSVGEETPVISVKLDFGTFTFERRCEAVNGTPTVTVYLDGAPAKSIKNGEAWLHTKLGLTDIILSQNKDFDIVKFLLNPLYFDEISPSALRKFLYMLSDTDFKAIEESQNAKVRELIEKRGIYDPYLLADAISKDKKNIKKTLDICKGAKGLFPSIEKEATELEATGQKLLKGCEIQETLIGKYILAVSKKVNAYYQKAMGIKVCLLEEGVGDGVYKDVCYPILPMSGLPFAVGSYAERSYVGMRFIQEVCLKYNIKPLPILLDNMESLDMDTEKLVDSLGVQYIGALVK